MRQELDELLCQRYPRIFCNRYASPVESWMHWGFTCGDGWFDLNDSLCAAISSRVTGGTCPPVVAREVKEKLGRLNFRFRGGDEEIRRLTLIAESLSETTCERCGNTEATFRGVTQGVLCPRCLVQLALPSFEGVTRGGDPL